MAALLDGIRNTVTAHATRAITNGLQKVAGNLLGGLTGGSSSNPASAAAAINKKNKYTTENLTYPLNVDDPSGSGHYIIFRINVQEKAQLKAQAAKTSMKQFEMRLKAELAIDEKEYKNTTESYYGENEKRKKKIKTDLLALMGIVDYDKTKSKPESSGNGKSTKKTGPQGSIALKNKTTKRIKTAIALYMPPSINVGYAANYGETEIGAAAEATAAAIKSAMGGDYRNMGKSLIGGVESLIRTAATTALDTVAPGAKALIALERGRVVTPRMELMFQSMGRRSFSYEFNFIPKSEAESKVVEKIVKEFKMQMAADFMGGGIVGVREMNIPSTFDIEYMYKTAQNTHLNKIGTCVLDSVDVSYGGDKFVAYAGGAPQSTKISLKFTEMEIITKSRVGEGY